MNSRSWSRVPKKLAIALASLAGFLLAANALVAWLWPDGALIFQLDPVLLHRFRPHTSRILRMDRQVGGQANLIEINGHGFRGAELEQPRSRLRVAVYGDSLVVAGNVALDETFCERLRLELDPSRVEVVNAGVTGYGPDQALLKLEQELPWLAPDLVVFVLCAHNDFGDLLRNKIFRVDESELTEASYTLGEEVLADFEEKRARASRPALWRALREWREHRARWKSWRETRAAPSPPYIGWYLEASRQELADYEASEEVHSLFYDYYDADLALRPDSPSARAKLELMRAVLERVRDVCGARGVPLLALVVPTAVDLCPEFAIHVERRTYPGYSPERLTDLFTGLLEELEVEHVNLYGAFTDPGDPCRLFVGDTDFHWNAEGQAAAARLVAERLRATGFPP